MKLFIYSIFAAIMLIFSTQFYKYTVSLKGLEKQVSCRRLGIAFVTIGIAFLISRDVVFVFSGLILMMQGLRLIAHGLDRIDKKTFIDIYNDEESVHQSVSAELKAVEMSQELELSHGGRLSDSQSNHTTSILPKLKDIDISKDESLSIQKLVALPEE